MTETRGSGAFDERTALDRLEQFREDIARERARRRAVSDEFDSFVRSFKTPAPAEPAAPRAPTAPTSGPPARPPAPRPPAAARPAPPTDLPRPGSRETPPAPILPVDPHAVFPTEIDPRVPAPPRRRRLALVMLAVLILGAAAAWALWPRDAAVPPPETVPSSAPAPAPNPAEPPAASSDTAAGATAAPSGNRVTELTTTRNAWVRIIADGERVLERELPAGSRIPITAQKTIVIRTGDAGAVSLTIAGEDQGTLGREGQVVTRTFAVQDR